jgi:hypothetical protein
MFSYLHFPVLKQSYTPRPQLRKGTTECPSALQFEFSAANYALSFFHHGVWCAARGPLIKAVNRRRILLKCWVIEKMAEMLLLSGLGATFFRFRGPTSFESARLLGAFPLVSCAPAVRPFVRRHHTITHSCTKEEPGTLRGSRVLLYSLPCNSLNECWRSKLAAAALLSALLGALCRKKVSAPHANEQEASDDNWEGAPARAMANLMLSADL